MITFFGILLLIGALMMLVLKLLSTKEDVVDNRSSGYQRVIKQKSPDFILNWNNKVSYLGIGLAIFMFLIPYLFFFAERGYSYLLVFPGGKMDAVIEQGIKYRGFAKIDEWQKYIDIKVVSGEAESGENELEGIMKPVPIRFIDQVTAEGYVSTRFELPRDKESFIQLAVKYRTMSNLVNNTIIPTIREQLINTGYMFAAQNYISGEAQAFRQTFEEQLKGGSYAVEKIEYKDTVYEEIESKTKTNRRIKEIQTKYEVKKQLVDGLPKRLPHELSENNVLVSQVIIDKIDLEPTFKQRLEAQRDESAKRQLEQQKIETAKAAQQRIVAEGERDKAAERVTQEKEQVKALIAIETKLKQEATNKELAAIALETERILAQKVKVKADADAYEIQKKVFAGITPEKELEMRLDADVRKAAEIAKIKFPETMIITSDGKNGTTPLESLIGAAMAKQLTTTNTQK